MMGRDKSELDRAWESLGNGEITELPTFEPAFNVIVDAAPAINRELTRLAALEATEVKPTLPVPQRSGPEVNRQWLSALGGVKPGQVTTRGRVNTAKAARRDANAASDCDKMARAIALAEKRARRKARR